MGQEKHVDTVNMRIQRLREIMKERGIHAWLVPTSDSHESEYVGEHFKCRHFITGFTGTAGTAVITQDKAGLWTDGRYFVQAGAQLAGTCVELFKMGSPEVPSVEAFLKEQIPEGGKLGFDGRVINDELGSRLFHILQEKNITISYEEDLVGKVWTERPPLSCKPCWLLEEKYAGKSAEEKITRLRDDMKDLGADVHILTTLDEIAWLLNLRGDDIPNNPVFLAYAMVTQEDFWLFIQEEAVKGSVHDYLLENKIVLHPYNAIYSEIRKLSEKTILLERKKVNYAIYESLNPSNRIIDRMNLCATYKVVKNPVEIENMKNAHIKDGTAVTKFMYWLKNCDVKEIGNMTEMTAAKRIEALRAEQEGYLGTSFVTISAYGSNAAMCHYHPSEEICSQLKPEGLLLVDSGGQYLEGTTDITRTYALGPLTEREKEYYTLVSMSMLKAGDMKFLYGCSGINLDYTIRESFWQRGLDFNHGTGHGVGYLSTVHERPNGIRWKVVQERQDSAVIEAGMICSDEPGLYFEGEFGVRTENMLLCVEDEKNSYGQFLRFKFLTWAPIDLDAVDTKFMDGHDVERLNRYHEEVYKKIAPNLTGEEAKWLKSVTRPVSLN